MEEGDSQTNNNNNNKKKGKRKKLGLFDNLKMFCIFSFQFL